MKTKLLQLMALGAMMLVPIGVGAQSFGTDDVIGTTTLWTFDQYQANDQIPDGNFAGLYIKSHEASTKPNKAGLSVCTSTFGDKTVYTLNYCALEGGYTSSMKTSDIKERKASIS